MNKSVLVLLVALAGWTVRSAVADDPGRVAVDRLMASTVTVRFATQAPPNATPQQLAVEAAGDEEGRGSEIVSVCSGVAVDARLIVTFAGHQTWDRVRITLPGGEQAAARMKVIDKHSGLTLLETETMQLAPLELDDAEPTIGAEIWTASAAGIEPAVISRGILGGTDRTLAGAALPPLLQCDLRATETATGAPVVNAEGQLIGIVASTLAPAAQNGWLYALPIQHVKRLLDSQTPDGVNTLMRQRPRLGLQLGQGEKEGSVVVERVEPNGPAEKAGLRVGDEVIYVDGRRIRHVYQVVDLTQRKQPGDKLQVGVAQDAYQKSVDVTLGVATPGEAAQQGQLPLNVQLVPQLGAARSGEADSGIRVRNTYRNQAPAQEALGDLQAAQAELRADSPLDRNELLQQQLAAIQRAIAAIQEKLEQDDERQRDSDELIQQLTDEVARLRRQLGGDESP